MIQKITFFIKKFWFRIVFLTVGLGSLIWFLVRVVPKPSRINYPCMKAATPLAYSFVAYILGLGTFTFVMKKARERFKQSKYVIATMFVLIGLAAGIITVVNNGGFIMANTVAVELQGPQAGNEPIGEAKGIFPGRVVWEHDVDATNKNYIYSSSNSWQDDNNTNQAVVSAMLSAGLQNLTGTTSDAEAWDAIFKYYNNANGRGDVGYVAGEKIAIKLNLNGGGRYEHEQENINTSPHIALALLNQLINIAGIAEADIHIGDPNKAMYDSYYYKLHNDFSNVKYWGDGAGRTSLVKSASRVLKYSDGNFEHYIPQPYIDATYMINVPVFKKHHRAGISFTSKNHFGSLCGETSDMHYTLPVPNTASSSDRNDNYGAYRCFVDIMGHEHMGGKTILYLVDGLWGSINWGHPPIKFRKPPFNIDWPNSLFLSQDPVAVQSVCFDFLYFEFDEKHPEQGGVPTDADGPFPHFGAADDFLHQAASSANWPVDPDTINYDPEQDGSILGSLGTHEHWNDTINKQYSRNLGTGNGIDLMSPYVVSVVEPPESVNSIDIPEGFELYPNYPNPFNESTTIHYKLAIPSSIQLRIYSSNGQLIKEVYYDNRMVGAYSFVWDGTNNNGSPVPTGTYICSLIVHNTRGSFDMNNKMLVLR